MANYSYKDVVYNIPPQFEVMFEQCYGREPDGDPNYNGDCWTLVGMWIDSLQAENAHLKDQLMRSAAPWQMS